MREGKARVLTKSELNNILKVMSQTRHPNRNIALLLFSFATGARVSEIASLTLGDLLENGKIREVFHVSKKNSKTKKNREIYFTCPRARAALKTYIDERANVKNTPLSLNSPLFESQKAGKFSANTLQMLFSRLYQLGGLIGAKSHSGRRTMATNLLYNGVDINSVKVLLGHENISTTAGYIESNPDLLKQIASKVI